MRASKWVGTAVGQMEPDRKQNENQIMSLIDMMELCPFYSLLALL